MNHSGGGAPDPNGLLNNLIAYWPGNEAAGNALDLHTNALHLTDMFTVTSNLGLVYPLARQYTRLNLEYHQRMGDDALLSAGDVELTIAAWCYLDSKPAGQMGIASKFNGPVEGSYAIIWDNTIDRFRFAVSNDGAALIYLTANSFGAPALTNWYLVIAWHDPTANQVYIQVNNGVVDNMAHATGLFDNTYPFWIGGWYASGNWDGRIGPTMFWKSAGGGGGVLTAAQRTALWNGGAGLPYAAFVL